MSTTQDVGIALAIDATHPDDDGTDFIGIDDGALFVVVAVDRPGRILIVHPCYEPADTDYVGVSIMEARGDREAVEGGAMRLHLALTNVAPGRERTHSYELAEGTDVFVFAVDHAGRVFFAQSVVLAELGPLGPALSSAWSPLA